MLSLKPYKNTLLDLTYLFALSFFFLLFDLGKGSLASWDEGIYAAVAKEIIRSGDWFHLTLGGTAWVDKPPLAIWATAFFYKIFGINEFSARLFSASTGIATVYVTYLLGRELLNRWVGFLGALVLLSSSHFIRFARFGMLDIPLTLFISLALYFFWKGREKNRYLIFSGIAIGLAVMTKGLAAFLIFPIIWIYCALSGELDILTRSSYWIGVMIAVAIALPWHLFQLTIHHDLFVREAVFKHLFGRMFYSLEGHVGGLDYYLHTAVNKYRPWILIGIFSAPFFVFKAIWDRDPESIFLAVWIFFIFILISLVKTKLRWYILPLYPALSLTVGSILAKPFGEKQAYFVRLMFLAIMILHVPYTHIFRHDYSRDIKGIAPLVRSEVPAGGLVYLYNYHETPASLFYLERKVSDLEDSPGNSLQDFFVKRAREDREFFCLIHEKDLSPLILRLPSGVSIAGTFEDLKLVVKKSQ